MTGAIGPGLDAIGPRATGPLSVRYGLSGIHPRCMTFVTKYIKTSISYLLSVLSWFCLQDRPAGQGTPYPIWRVRKRTPGEDPAQKFDKISESQNAPILIDFNVDSEDIGYNRGDGSCSRVIAAMVSSPRYLVTLSNAS